MTQLHNLQRSMLQIVTPGHLISQYLFIHQNFNTTWTRNKDVVPILLASTPNMKFQKTLLCHALAPNFSNMHRLNDSKHLDFIHPYIEDMEKLVNIHHLGNIELPDGIYLWIFSHSGILTFNDPYYVINEGQGHKMSHQKMCCTTVYTSTKYHLI